MAQLRTFIAIELGKEIRERIAILVRRLEKASVQVRWVRPENLHLTLSFLGDVNERQLADVCQAASDATSRMAPFEIDSFGAGAFPSIEKPRTIWGGFDAGGEQVTELHHDIEHELGERRIRTEGRRFHPHITIGRIRDAGDGVTKLSELIAKNDEFPIGTFTVSEVIIFSSQLRREGPEYQVIGRAKLHGDS